MIKSKTIRPSYNISFDYIFFDKKSSQFNPNVFLIMLVYITNKIYAGTPPFMLYQFVQKLNDINQYL